MTIKGTDQGVDKSVLESVEADVRWLEGATLFNNQAYWEAHEAWEPLWLEADGLERHLYSGVILLAAALHKARAMANPQGGRRNYAKALAHLALLPEHLRGVAIRLLEAEVHAALQDPSRQPQLPTTLESHD